MAGWIENHMTQLIGALVLAAILGLYTSIRESEIEDNVQDRTIREQGMDIEDQFSKFDHIGQQYINALEEEIKVTREEKNRDISYWQQEAAYWRSLYLECKNNK